MISRRCFAALALMLIAGLALPISSSGQDATPVASPAATPIASPGASPEASPAAVTGAPRLDLAAMALNNLDIPTEFNLVLERYIPGSQFGELYLPNQIPQAEIDATNLLWFYESIYITPDGTANLRSYVEEYPDIESAMAGFELLEDEPRIVGPDANYVDEPIPGIGEEPSEISVGSNQPSVGDADAQSIDLTFRVGRIIAGVSSDTISGVAVDRDLVIEMARRLEERIEAVMSAEPLPQIDYELAGKVVPIGDPWHGVNEGYFASFEVYGEEAATPVEADFVSGYLRSVAAGRVLLGEIPIPLIAVSVAEFGSEESALSMLSNVELWQPPYIGVERLTLDRVAGASAVLGFQYANPVFAGAQVDSVRIIMIVDTSVVTIDVQGAPDVDTAREAAASIAATQAGCLTSDGPCTEPELPAGLYQPPPGAPSTNQDPVG